MLKPQRLIWQHFSLASKCWSLAWSCLHAAKAANRGTFGEGCSALHVAAWIEKQEGRLVDRIALTRRQELIDPGMHEQEQASFVSSCRRCRWSSFRQPVRRHRGTRAAVTARGETVQGSLGRASAAVQGVWPPLPAPLSATG
jgi:hypothetical protein